MLHICTYFLARIIKTLTSGKLSIFNTCTYTGREWDKETGLYYYRARYYDPIEGRFISKDPIGFGGGDITLYDMSRMDRLMRLILMGCRG